MNRARILGGGLAACMALATPCVSYYEGMIPHTYADPVGIPTFCYGHTGADVTPGRIAKPGECKELLDGDLGKTWIGVSQCTYMDLTPAQAAAVTSFAYNAGVRTYCGSTMARLINAGADASVWCQQLKRWTYATKFGVKIELPGLVARRNAEYNLCIEHDAKSSTFIGG